MAAQADPALVAPPHPAPGRAPRRRAGPSRRRQPRRAAPGAHSGQAPALRQPGAGTAAARSWRDNLGAARDVAQAVSLADRLGAAPELVAFLRGVLVGRAQR